MLVTHWPTYAIKRTFQPKHSTSNRPDTGRVLNDSLWLFPVTITFYASYDTQTSPLYIYFFIIIKAGGQMPTKP